jgi:hypothetical protein
LAFSPTRPIHSSCFSASPALVHQELYLRGERFLYCLAEEELR